MLASTTNKPFVALASLLFLCAAALLTLIGLRIQIHDGNYAAVYVGFGVWLECVYLTVHFLLQLALHSRPALVATISRVLAAIILLPIGLIIAIQVVLLEQSIHFNGTDVGTLVFAALVFLLLFIPFVFMTRFVLGARPRRRVQQIVEPDPPPASFSSN
jgi:hypothetical protein